MIARLSGRIADLADGQAVIDVNGVGYLVGCSARTLGRLEEGTTCTLLVETHWREDGPHLYGFLDAAERRWFRLLVGIPGVGPKVALGMLGCVAPDELAMAVAAGDRTVLTRAPGVGTKLAVRIATELKDKVTSLPAVAAAGSGTGSAPAGGSAVADAVSALVNLGFRPAEAQAAVATAAGRIAGEASCEALIRGGLAQLTQAQLTQKELRA